MSNKNLKLEMKALIKKNLYNLVGLELLKIKIILKIYIPSMLYLKELMINLNLKKIICLKIDVEGHEIFVLDGLSRLFKNNKIFLQIEILPSNYNKVIKKLKHFDLKKINQINANFYFTESLCNFQYC